MYMCTRYLGNNVFHSEASLEDILTGHFVVDLKYYVMEQIDIANHNNKNSCKAVVKMRSMKTSI